jgi:hypothetical protein
MFSLQLQALYTGGKRDHGDNLGPTADMNVVEMKKGFIIHAPK